MSPREYWDAACEIDPKKTPWELLTPDQRRRWRAYVNSGNYEKRNNA